MQDASSALKISAILFDSLLRVPTVHCRLVDEVSPMNNVTIDAIGLDRTDGMLMKFSDGTTAG